jgi:hypothetical protein
MPRRLRHLGVRFLGGAVMLAGVPAPAVAWAQDVVPQPELRRAPQVWVGYFFMVLLAAAVMGVSLLPSKRGHQD